MFVDHLWDLSFPLELLLFPLAEAEAKNSSSIATDSYYQLGLFCFGRGVLFNVGARNLHKGPGIWFQKQNIE